MGEIVTVSQTNPDSEVVGKAASVLRDAGVLVMPTDSVYGMGCVATKGNPAHDRIFHIKRRNRAQTLPWLIASESDLLAYGKDVPAWMKGLAHELWPGALTLVVLASNAVPREYVASDGTIALRVPDSELVRMLAREVGPLATTSANTHGEDAATSGANVEDSIVRRCDLTLDSGPAPISVPSTIVGEVNGEPCIYREGAIPAKRIWELLEQER